MSTCYLVRDQNGNPAPSVSISVNYDGKSLSAISRIDGIARFEADVPDYAVIVQPYNVKVTRAPCLESPPPPPPSTSGEDFVMNVGTSCKLYGFQISTGQRFFKIRDQNGSQIGSGYPNWRDAQAFGQKAPQCNQKPQPTQQEWQQGIVESIAEFGEGLTRAVSGVRSAQDALQRAFDAFKDGLYDWLVSRVLDAILQALDREVENHGR